MDGIAIGAIVLFVLVGPWILVWWANASRKREREEDQERTRELASRISVLGTFDTETPSAEPSRKGHPDTPRPNSTCLHTAVFRGEYCFAAAFASCRRADRVCTAGRELGETEGSRNCNIGRFFRGSSNSARAKASRTTSEFRRVGANAVPGRPRQVLTRHRGDARHELAQQTGHRRLVPPDRGQCGL